MRAQGGGLKGAAIGAIFDQDVRHGEERILSVAGNGHSVQLHVTGDRVQLQWQYRQESIVELRDLPQVADVNTVLEEESEALLLGFSGGDVLRVQVRPNIALIWEHGSTQLMGKTQTAPGLRTAAETAVRS